MREARSAMSRILSLLIHLTIRMGPYGEDFPDEILRKLKPKEEKDPLKWFCPEKTDATTMITWRSVIWCPDSHDNKAATFGTVNVAEAMPTTLSLVWIHELAHVWTGREKGDEEGHWADGEYLI